jgi:tRNA1(Val) A37 N6-methylase TrmN6
MLGQYFTTSKLLQSTVNEFILNEPKHILEPTAGQGDLVLSLQNHFENVKITAIEIDDTIIPLSEIFDQNKIIYCDFMKIDFNKFTTIAVNPPFVKISNGNLYTKILNKCLDLLEPEGEMIAIVPADFFTLNYNNNLINQLFELGNITNVTTFTDEKLFKDCQALTLIFRFQKTETKTNICNYNDKLLFIENNDGYVTFNEEQNLPIIGDHFHVIFVKSKIPLYLDEPCIYVYNITNEPKVAWLGTVSYSHKALFMLVPKKPMDLTDTLDFLNSDKFIKTYKFCRRFKVGQRQLRLSKINIFK